MSAMPAPDLAADLAPGPGPGPARPVQLVRFLADEAGTAAIGAMFWLFIMVAFAGLAIDSANAFRVRTAMQATADSAAAAAAMELPNLVAARDRAEAYLEANLPAADNGEMAEWDDIEFGRWDSGAKEFRAGWLPYNAVSVSLWKNAERGNAPPTFLLGMVGQWDWTVSARAIARAPGVCSHLRAYETIAIRKEAYIGSGVCIYGREGVTLERLSVAMVGAKIGMRDDANFDPGLLSVIPPGTVFEDDLVPLRAMMISDAIDAWEGGKRLPPGWTTEVVTELPLIPLARRIYIVEGDLTVSKSHSFVDAVIAVRGDVRIKKDGEIASADGCAVSAPVGLYATGAMYFGKESSLRGVDVVAGGPIDADKDMILLDAIMESASYMDIKKDPSFGLCRPQYAVFGVPSSQLMR